MKIGKYKKISSNKYNVELGDKKINIYEDVIIKNNLLLKSEMSEKELDNLINDNEYYKIYNKCLNYISIRIRSEYEIKKYLDKEQIDIQKKVLNQLRINGLINDELFVKSYINDKLLLSIYGPFKIKGELLKHFIDEDIIDKYIDQIDKNTFDEKINNIINKYIKINSRYPLNKLKNKLYYYLNINGYSQEMFGDKLNNIKTNDKDKLNKEYLKIYNKYKGKYKDSALDNKIKSSLYGKGYNIPDINELLEK